MDNATPDPAGESGLTEKEMAAVKQEIEGFASTPHFAAILDQLRTQLIVQAIPTALPEDNNAIGIAAGHLLEGKRTFPPMGCVVDTEITLMIRFAPKVKKPVILGLTGKRLN